LGGSWFGLDGEPCRPFTAEERAAAQQVSQEEYEQKIAPSHRGLKEKLLPRAIPKEGLRLVPAEPPPRETPRLQAPRGPALWMEADGTIRLID